MPEYQQPVERLVAALGADSRRGLTVEENPGTPGSVRGERARLATASAAGENSSRSSRTSVGHPAAGRDGDFGGALVVRTRFRAAYEAIAISGVVLLNAVMGYVQESRAESA